ncbi:MAG: hypothetical protein AB7P14_17460 [Blastocatellales bacterium]
MQNTNLEVYEQLMIPARQQFETSYGLATLLEEDIEPDYLELFLVYFCAIGAQMTAPVEGWIRRAGERCTALGLNEIGDALHRHSKAEAGHDQLMLADVKSLVGRWNACKHWQLDLEHLLHLPQTPGVARYVEVHEDNICGPNPFAQIAIEYEIERLTLLHGERLVARCVRLCGDDILACLTFLPKHIELDGGHTKFNARELTKVIEANPSSVPTLVAAGSAALDAYGTFISDCLGHAKDQLARLAPSNC